MTKRHLLLTGLLLVLVVWRAEAQFTPQGFSYQCIVRDDNGASLNNQTVNLLFTIRSGAANGPVAYSEMQTSSTNEFGLINLFIGQGTPLQGVFTNINWGGSAKYLTVSVETAPNVFDELGTTQLMSVPYALYAQNTANSGDDWGAQAVQTAPVFDGDGTNANPLTLAQQSATAGQVLKWGGTTWVPQDDNGTVTEINTGVGLTGGPITSSGTIGLENTAVTPGLYGSATQIPVISVDEYGRVTDVFTVTPQPSSIGVTGAAGISVAQNGLNFTITNTGDTDATDDITTSSQADGDVSGPFSDLQIKANAVGTAEIADNAITNSKIADNAVNTAELANGAVTASKINDMGASSGQVLKWTGTTWAPAADALGSTSISSGTGISVTGAANNFTITNTGDTDPSDDLTLNSVANGDITGQFSNLQIKPDVVGDTELTSNAVTTVKLASQAVTGEKIAQMSAANGQVLKWNGSTWAPAADNLGTVTITGGVGIDVIAAGNNYTIANNGDINPFDDITQNSPAGGDISGTFDNLQINQSVVTNFELSNNAVSTAKIQDKAVNGDKIAQMNALTGQVLKWNGTNWMPATDAVGADNWGTQVAITAPTISGNGTLASPLAIAQQNATNGQVLKWNGTAWAPDDEAAGDDWGTQSAFTSVELDGDGTAGNPLRIAEQSAAAGQILKFNGTNWLPADDAGGDDWGAQTAVTDGTITGDGSAGNALGIAQQGATNDQVLKWNGATWAPADEAAGDDWGTQSAFTSFELDGDGTAGNPLRIADQGAATGQILKFNGANWLPGDEAGGDDWGAQTAVTDGTITGDGSAGNALGIAQQGATNDQVLKWNGATWAPADEAAGDDWGTQSAFTSFELDGDGTVGNPLRIADQGAAAGQILKFNGANWLPGDEAGGDDWGAQTAVADATIKGDGSVGNALGIAQQGATNDQVLKWNGTTWAPADDASGDDWGAQSAFTSFELDGNGTAGDPLRIADQSASAGQVLKFDGANWLPADDNTGTGPADNWGSQVAITNATLEGDGTAGNGLGIAQQGATTDQVLKWNGTTWAPADDTGGDDWGTQTAFTSFELEGDGTAGDPLRIADQSAVAGQILKFDGTFWLPGDDVSDLNNYAAGTGIDITGTAPNFTIENTGDLDATNELQTISLTGDELTLSNGGGTVNLPSGNTYAAGTGIDITGTAPNFVIENTGDDDNDATNELQSLSLNGKILKISGMNTEINLDTILTNGGTSLWESLGANIYNGNSGNVGIGTDAPAAKLHVFGDGEIIRLEGNEPGLGFSNGGGPAGAYIEYSDLGLILAASDSSSIVLATDGGKTLFVDGTTGNVGIGGPNTSNAQLKVLHNASKGGLMIENTLGASWEFRVDAGTGGMALFNNTLGPVPAGFFGPNGVYTASDRRLKKDILDLSSVLDQVMQLKPVSYHYKQESADSKVSLGFIAQEVDVLFPELVGTASADDGQKYMSVNYAGFSVLAIKSIQEQQKQIQVLEQENKTLLSRLLALESRVQNIEHASTSAQGEK